MLTRFIFLSVLGFLSTHASAQVVDVELELNQDCVPTPNGGVVCFKDIFCSCERVEEGSKVDFHMRCLAGLGHDMFPLKVIDNANIATGSIDLCERNAQIVNYRGRMCGKNATLWQVFLSDLTIRPWFNANSVTRCLDLAL